MLLPDTQVMVAQQQIEERIRRSEQHQREEEAAHEREASSTHEPARRGWLRQLFLGKSGT